MQTQHMKFTASLLEKSSRGRTVFGDSNLQNTSNANRRLLPLKPGHPASSGQILAEFAMMLPLFLLLLLGIIEISFLLYNQNVVIKLAREGSNLISRDATLQEASNAMASISSFPMDFSSNRSRLIFSVIHQGTTGINAGKPILYQRFTIGGLSASSALVTQGTGSYGGPPDYIAINADNDANLQITNLPANVILQDNGFFYLTEVFSSYVPISPFQNFGFKVPEILGASAYF